ncbi:hypothetical protein NDU88_000861 [Pleurodeles waltl]|uniref:Uncharacterized protein n=1 Tax=Pleurodeles waltl TaxID=8319 RepID=A0AAV7LJR6_PLEWA|nr:hypothetical protein NDU88_000861 [Pleurodeles waltl]
MAGVEPRNASLCTIWYNIVVGHRLLMPEDVANAEDINDEYDPPAQNQRLQQASLPNLLFTLLQEAYAFDDGYDVKGNEEDVVLSPDAN